MKSRDDTDEEEWGNRKDEFKRKEAKNEESTKVKRIEGRRKGEIKKQPWEEKEEKEECLKRRKCPAGGVGGEGGLAPGCMLSFT